MLSPIGKKNTAPIPIAPSVSIGGIGGSGTRLIMQLLSDSGIDMGFDLNASNDDLLFTFLFRRPELFGMSQNTFEERYKLFIQLRTNGLNNITDNDNDFLRNLVVAPMPQMNLSWREKRLKQLQNVEMPPHSSSHWGWKEPNTHIFIRSILQTTPSLKYIHVMRNGLDMAYSSNQNQLGLWGDCVLGTNCDNTPRSSLKFWKKSHEQIQNLCRELPNSVYLLNFDNLCESFFEEIYKLFEFLEIPIDEHAAQQLAARVSVPESVGRYLEHPSSDFDLRDIEFVKNAGFKIASRYYLKPSLKNVSARPSV